MPALESSTTLASFTGIERYTGLLKEVSKKLI
jgi:hypothetical protein